MSGPLLRDDPEATLRRALAQRAPGVELWSERDIISRKTRVSLGLRAVTPDSLSATGWLSERDAADGDALGVMLTDTLDDLRMVVAEAVGMDEFITRQEQAARRQAFADLRTAVGELTRSAAHRRRPVDVTDVLALLDTLGDAG